MNSVWLNLDPPWLSELYTLPCGLDDGLLYLVCTHTGYIIAVLNKNDAGRQTIPQH